MFSLVIVFSIFFFSVEGQVEQIIDFSFNELKSCVPFTVKVVSGDDFGVELVGDESVKPKITAEIDTQIDGWKVLNIQTIDAFSTNQTVSIYITVPRPDSMFRKVTLSGSGDIEIHVPNAKQLLVVENKGSGILAARASSNQLQIINSGSGSVIISGTFPEVTITNSGSGDVYLQGGFNVETGITGAGNVYVQGIDTFTTIDLQSSGTGTLFYDEAECTDDFVIPILEGDQPQNFNQSDCVNTVIIFPSTIVPFTCGMETEQASQCGADFVVGNPISCSELI